MTKCSKISTFEIYERIFGHKKLVEAIIQPFLSANMQNTRKFNAFIKQLKYGTLNLCRYVLFFYHPNILQSVVL